MELTVGEEKLKRQDTLVHFSFFFSHFNYLTFVSSMLLEYLKYS
jgi:hypothetical protein